MRALAVETQSESPARMYSGGRATPTQHEILNPQRLGLTLTDGLPMDRSTRQRVHRHMHRVGLPKLPIHPIYLGWTYPTPRIRSDASSSLHREHTHISAAEQLEIKQHCLLAR